MNKKWTQYLMSKPGVAWFECNEASGNVLDSKGSFVGTPTNVTRVDNGQGGNALDFNGTSSYVRFNDKVIPQGKKSVFFRIKTNTIKTTAQVIMTNTTLNSNGSYGMDFQISPIGTLSIALRNGTTPNFTSLTSIKPITDGQWHDVLFTWDGTTHANSAKLYIDNLTVPIDTITPTMTENNPPTNNLTLGRLGDYNFENYRYFTGQLDNIQIYNDVVDSVEKLSLIKSSNKIQVLSNGAWEDTGLTEPLTQQDFETHGMADLSGVNSDTLNLLEDEEFEVITWTAEERTPTLSSIQTKPIPWLESGKLYEFEITKEMKLIEFSNIVLED